MRSRLKGECEGGLTASAALLAFSWLDLGYVSTPSAVFVEYSLSNEQLISWVLTV